MTVSTDYLRKLANNQDGGKSTAMDLRLALIEAANEIDRLRFNEMSQPRPVQLRTYNTHQDSGRNRKWP